MTTTLRSESDIFYYMNDGQRWMSCSRQHGFEFIERIKVCFNPPTTFIHHHHTVRPLRAWGNPWRATLNENRPLSSWVWSWSMCEIACWQSDVHTVAQSHRNVGILTGRNGILYPSSPLLKGCPGWQVCYLSTFPWGLSTPGCYSRPSELELLRGTARSRVFEVTSRVTSTHPGYHEETSLCHWIHR